MTSGMRISYVSAFVLGAVAAFCFMMALSKKAKKDGSKHAGKKKLGTMDLILILVGAFILIFTIDMRNAFLRTGTEPATLITCVFAFCGGECGIMGWIRTTKERYKEREWQREDEERRDKEDDPE